MGADRALSMELRWQDPIYRERRRVARANGVKRMQAGEGFIYVAEEVGGARVKIGFSLNPKVRVAHLTDYGDSKFRLLAATPGSFKQEMALHRTLGMRSGGREIYPRSILSHPAIPAELRGVA